MRLVIHSFACQYRVWISRLGVLPQRFIPYVLLLTKTLLRSTPHNYGIKISIWFSSRYSHLCCNLLVGFMYKSRFYHLRSRILAIYLYNLPLQLLTSITQQTHITVQAYKHFIQKINHKIITKKFKYLTN
jgi:hypothetical protein